MLLQRWNLSWLMRDMNKGKAGASQSRLRGQMRPIRVAVGSSEVAVREQNS